MSANESLSSVNSSMNTYKSGLSQAWVALEVPIYETAINEVTSLISSIKGKIDSLNSSISQAYEDIRREEEAERARRAAEEAARLAAQQQAQSTSLGDRRR